MYSADRPPQFKRVTPPLPSHPPPTGSDESLVLEKSPQRKWEENVREKPEKKDKTESEKVVKELKERESWGKGCMVMGCQCGVTTVVSTWCQTVTKYP